MFSIVPRGPQARESTMKRREFIALLGGAAAWPLAARAQQAEPVRRVGALLVGAKDDPGVQSNIAVFRERLAMLGWVEGGNLRIDYRFADSDPGRVAAYAEELVNLRPDLILAFGGPPTQAVQQRTSVIPIVFTAGDPASNDLVGNIARPGGNMTGFALDFGSLGGKWLELFKEAVPGLTNVAHILSAISLTRNETRATIDAAATRLGVTIVRMTFRDAAEIEPTISAFAAAPNGGLLVTGNVARAQEEAIRRLALHYRLPLMIGPSTIVAEGVLMSHGTDRLDRFGRLASYVDRILRGAKPSDLPVQYPTKFELAVNLKTAKAIGVTIPEGFLLRADEVIE
jgi:putative ABC transport system substrate-binding protein